MCARQEGLAERMPRLRQRVQKSEDVLLVPDLAGRRRSVRGGGCICHCDVERESNENRSDSRVVCPAPDAGLRVC